MILLQVINIPDSVNNVVVLPRFKTEHNQAVNATGIYIKNKLYSILYIGDNVSFTEERQTKCNT